MRQTDDTLQKKKNQLENKQHSSLGMSVGQMARIAMMIAFISVMSFIRIPLPFSDAALTGQTLAMNVIALVLVPKEAFITMLCYWLLGLVGVPVFGGMAGPGKMFGPGGGYFMAFMLAVLLIGKLRGDRYHFGRYIVVTVLVGLIVVDGLGCVWLKLVTGFTWGTALITGVVAFAPLDIVKCVAACIVAKPLQRAMRIFDKNVH